MAKESGSRTAKKASRVDNRSAAKAEDRSAGKAEERGTAKASGEGAAKAEIERTDRELVKLLNQRAQAYAQLYKHSLAANGPVPPPQPEPEAVERALAQNKGPLSTEALRAIFRELTSASRALERPTRLAVLGPAYSYSHLAAIDRFGTSVEHVPVGSIAAVFEEVNRGHAAFGVVPLENSTDGRIADTLEMFTRLPVRICGEVQLKIHHFLLGRCARADISEVYSRPQALSQCRNWLLRHLPAARTVEVTSTSTAAQLAHDKEGAAAIASLQAGVHYGLDVLAEHIEDNAANVTRFAVLGHESAPRTGHDKTALMFQVAHKPGSLADSIAIFKRGKLNLTWIESFPIPQSEGQYLFFVEVDGHEKEARLRKALDALTRKALRLEVLGSYPRGQSAG